MDNATACCTQEYPCHFRHSEYPCHLKTKPFVTVQAISERQKLKLSSIYCQLDCASLADMGNMAGLTWLETQRCMQPNQKSSLSRAKALSVAVLTQKSCNHEINVLQVCLVSCIRPDLTSVLALQLIVCTKGAADCLYLLCTIGLYVYIAMTFDHNTRDFGVDA